MARPGEGPKETHSPRRERGRRRAILWHFQIPSCSQVCRRNLPSKEQRNEQARPRGRALCRCESQITRGWWESVVASGRRLHRAAQARQQQRTSIGATGATTPGTRARQCLSCILPYRVGVEWSARPCVGMSRPFIPTRPAHRVHSHGRVVDRATGTSLCRKATVTREAECPGQSSGAVIAAAVVPPSSHLLCGAVRKDPVMLGFGTDRLFSILLAVCRVGSNVDEIQSRLFRVCRSGFQVIRSQCHCAAPEIGLGLIMPSI